MKKIVKEIKQKIVKEIKTKKYLKLCSLYLIEVKLTF